MGMTGFICHDDYLNKTAKLTDEEVGRLFRACMVYHSTGEVQPLDGRESVAFDFIRDDIDRAVAAYEAKCEQNRKNRNSVNERQRPSTDVNERQQTCLKEQEQYINKNKEKSIKEKAEPQRRFTPPTLEQVQAYCRERGNSVDAQKFVDFYTSKGWKVGNQSMRDWKAAVRTWERGSGNVGKAVAAQEYNQRDYSDAQSEAMRRFLSLAGKTG